MSEQRKVPISKGEFVIKGSAVVVPTIDELLGIDPGWTGALTTDEYIARQRSTHEEKP